MTSFCRLCGSLSSSPAFSASLLGRTVNYYDCSTCGYVQTESPTWLARAYQVAINNCDTGIMLRNQLNVGIVLATLVSICRRDGLVVDYAGGYGILVRLLRDKGIEALWSDPYCANLLAKGFEYGNEKADLVMAFEAFEHFVEPVREVEKLLSIAPNLLLSTEIIPSPVPAPDQWWYYGLDHGQHIGFFREQTLQFLARHFGKYLVTDGRSYHLFTEAPVSTTRWKLNTRLAKRFPTFYSRGLRSKTWSDFQKITMKNEDSI